MGRLSFSAGISLVLVLFLMKTRRFGHSCKTFLARSQNPSAGAASVIEFVLAPVLEERQLADATKVSLSALGVPGKEKLVLLSNFAFGRSWRGATAAGAPLASLI